MIVRDGDRAVLPLIVEVIIRDRMRSQEIRYKPVVDAQTGSAVDVQ
jgi:hypothetical protein